MLPILFMGAGLLVFGGAAVVFQIAGDRGRDGSGWAMLSILVSAGAGWLAFASSTNAEEVTPLTGSAPIIAAALGHAPAIAALLCLPRAGATLRGSSWQLDVLGGRGDDSARLELRDGCLALGIGARRSRSRSPIWSRSPPTSKRWRSPTSAAARPRPRPRPRPYAWCRAMTTATSGSD